MPRTSVNDYIIDLSDLNFSDLKDTPQDYTGEGVKLVAVKQTEDGLEFVDGGTGGVDTFLELTDTPTDYNSSEGFVLKVKTDGSGLEFVEDTGGGTEILLESNQLYEVEDLTDRILLKAQALRSDGFELGMTVKGSESGAVGYINDIIGGTPFDTIEIRNIASNGISFIVGETLIVEKIPVYVNNLENIPSTKDGTDAGKVLAMSSDGFNHEYIEVSGGASTFASLTDTPTDYTDSAKFQVVVNDAGTGLEFKKDLGGKVLIESQQIGNVNINADYQFIEAQSIINDGFELGTTIKGIDSGAIGVIGKISSGFPFDNIRVYNETSNGINFIVGELFVKISTPINLQDLSNVPNIQTTDVGKVLAVSSDGYNHEYIDVASSGGTGGVTDFINLTDTPTDYTGNENKTVKVNSDGTALVFDDVTNVSTFSQLLDTPTSYTGEGNKVLTVKSTEDGVDYKLLNTSYLSDIVDVGSGSIITSSERSKLLDIEDGAEVNTVNSVNTITGDVVLDTSNISSTTDKRYVTDSDLTTLSNTSGVNTGDQDLSNLALKSNVLELDNTTTFTPSGDYQPATKKYVDDNAGGGGGTTASRTLYTPTYFDLLRDYTDLALARDDWAIMRYGDYMTVEGILRLNTDADLVTLSEKGEAVAYVIMTVPDIQDNYIYNTDIVSGHITLMNTSGHSGVGYVDALSGDIDGKSKIILKMVIEVDPTNNIDYYGKISYRIDYV